MLALDWLKEHGVPCKLAWWYVQSRWLKRVGNEAYKKYCFALKGGTAINLFFRNMPELSVDIDLTYLSIEPQEQFLKNISVALNTLTMISTDIACNTRCSAAQFA
ncbi:MAG: nucleotidyl transferase AbiEii/AbiGii toxin family protein [Gammaproteobacteria bacterium]|nr:nucleotidyl transferase AbiEii/AbiGii toxin family protein [Gammaproteobacteria bacterium]MCW5584005.1 nucleotidyl transferase AbiEii/AbiGii toxin family protein [Gammaproteobacteria bacterium]